MANGNGKFTIDYERLKKICLTAYQAYEDGRGVFNKRFLPHWNLPAELDYEPVRAETRNPDLAGNYLFVLASLERLTLSRINQRNGLNAWKNPELKWVFNPAEVVQRDVENLKSIFLEKFGYGLEEFPGNFLFNNLKIISEYGSRARNIVHEQTVEEARRRLMEFKGIGTGIANLFITYCTERNVAMVQDPYNRKLKIDVHKARVPVNTEAVSPVNKRVRRDLLVPALEESCLQICKEEDLDGGKLDAALWLIGSQVCARRSMKYCANFCPLERMCVSCVPENSNTGELIVYDDDGKRVETRRGIHQFHLDIGLYPE